MLTQFDPQGPPVRECPRHPDSRGGLFDYFWRTRDRIYGDRLAAAQAGRPPDAAPIAVFVHNHTLLVDWRQRVLELTRLGRTVIVDGFSPVRNALAPVVVNGGPWQRTITPVQFASAARRARPVGGGAAAMPCGRSTSRPATASSGSNRTKGHPALPAIRYWRADRGRHRLGDGRDVRPSARALRASTPTPAATGAGRADRAAPALNGSTGEGAGRRGREVDCEGSR